MSVSGLIRAMRSDRPPAERLVWMCLENHANGAGFWQISELDIARELHLTHSTVRRAIHALVTDGIVRAQRCKRRPTIFHMTRAHAKANGRNPAPKPKTPPSHADLTAQIDPLNLNAQLNLTAQVDPLNLSAPRAGLESKKDISRRDKTLSVTPKRRDPVSDPPGFAAFWQAYPRKVGKTAAARSWVMATKRASAADIMHGLANARFQPDPRFTPHPATWLNQGRWMDEHDHIDPTLRALGYTDTDDDDANPFLTITGPIQ